MSDYLTERDPITGWEGIGANPKYSPERYELLARARAKRCEADEFKDRYFNGCFPVWPTAEINRLETIAEEYERQAGEIWDKENAA